MCVSQGTYELDCRREEKSNKSGEAAFRFYQTGCSQWTCEKQFSDNTGNMNIAE